ncbi:MAG: cytochrome ubiquinol oxidase subunit I, partial [Chloroflexota bacterium]
QKQAEVFRPSFQLATVFGALSVLMVILIGHNQAQQMIKLQPMKFAAAEALLYTEDPASFSLLSVVNQETLTEQVSVRIPRLLSLLAYNRLDGEVKGIIDLQNEFEQKYGEGNYVPSIAVSYWSFRVMVGSGFIMLGLIGLALYRVLRNQLDFTRLGMNLFLPAIALPFVANIFGWLLTEMGRQPWVVYGKMLTVDAVSPNLTTGMVVTSLLGFTIVYGLLMAADVYLIRKYAIAGAELPVSQLRTTEEQTYWE